MTIPRTGHAPLTTRWAGSHDGEAIAQLHSEVQRLHHEADPQVYKPPSLQACREFVKARLADAMMHYVVVQNPDGAVVGYALAMVRHRRETTLTYPGTLIEVEELCVAQAAQRQGVARKLNAWVEAWARQQQVDELRINVRAFNAVAHQAYLAMGYEPVQHGLRRKLS